MKPYYSHDGNQIFNGHVLDVLRDMEPESVQTVVTSPPYWGLRDYGLEPQIWDELPSGECEYDWEQEATGAENRVINAPLEHKWGNKLPHSKEEKRTPEELMKSHNLTRVGQNNSAFKWDEKTPSSSGQFCIHCNAWRGSLGLEPTPELYIQHMVQVFSAVKRVLRKDGTLWLNLGDSYAGGGRGFGYGGKQDTNKGCEDMPKSIIPSGLKPKDLCMIPARVALALQAEGWWLRSQIPWLKKSAMPESVTDRPSTAVEYVYLFSKSQKYFYDNEAVRVPHTRLWNDNIGGNLSTGKHKLHGKYVEQERKTPLPNPSGRNRRNSDWFFESWQGLYSEPDPLAFVVNPQSFKEAHFATFSTKLVEPCILAGTSEKGCCPECGAPWVRVVEKNIQNNPIRQGDTGDRIAGPMARPGLNVAKWASLKL